MQSDETRIALIEQALKNIETFMKRIEVRLDRYENNFVKREEFTPIKAIVYAQVGLILTAFVAGLIFLVFK